MKFTKTILFTSIILETTEFKYFYYFIFYQVLLSNGASSLLEDLNGENALIAATKHQKLEIAKYLLSTVPEMTNLVNKTTANRDLCLLYACRSHDVEMIHLLLKYGADCFVTDYAHRTPLHYYYVNSANLNPQQRRKNNMKLQNLDRRKNLDEIYLYNGVNPNMKADGEDMPIVCLIKFAYFQKTLTGSSINDPAILNLVFRKLQLNLIAGLDYQNLDNRIVDVILKDLVSRWSYFQKLNVQDFSGKELQPFVIVNQAALKKYVIMIEFLHECGLQYKLSKTDFGIMMGDLHGYRNLMVIWEGVLTLQRLAANTIRLHLRPNALVGVTVLSLPHSIQDYIVMRDLIDMTDKHSIMEFIA